MTAWVAFGCGALIGISFAILGLPVPAPGSLAGIAGVVGLAVGYMIVNGVIG